MPDEGRDIAGSLHGAFGTGAMTSLIEIEEFWLLFRQGGQYPPKRRLQRAVPEGESLFRVDALKLEEER
jgi:hypothetical protein